MKGVSGGAETTSVWEASGEKSCNESNIPFWLDHSLLLKCVTVLSHPRLTTHTHTLASSRLVWLSAISLHIISDSGGPISLLPTKGFIQITTIKTGRLSLSFIFTTSFQGKKMRKHTHTHTHTLKTSCVPSHPIFTV